MDSNTICFQDLNVRQKLFQENLEDLVGLGNENKSKFVLNVAPINKIKHFFDNLEELSDEAKQQQTVDSVLLKEHNECSKEIADINIKIQVLEESLQKLKSEESLGKDELKQLKKPLVKAIKKYSSNFNIDVEVRKDGTDTFMASVIFLTNKNKKGMNPAVNFLIDRKERKIIGFNAESLLSEKENEELKNKALISDNELNIEFILSKLREFL